MRGHNCVNGLSFCEQSELCKVILEQRNQRARHDSSCCSENQLVYFGSILHLRYFVFLKIKSENKMYFLFSGYDYCQEAGYKVQLKCLQSTYCLFFEWSILLQHFFVLVLSVPGIHLGDKQAHFVDLTHH